MMLLISLSVTIPLTILFVNIRKKEVKAIYKWIIYGLTIFLNVVSIACLGMLMGAWKIVTNG